MATALSTSVRESLIHGGVLNSTTTAGYVGTLRSIVIDHPDTWVAPWLHSVLTMPPVDRDVRVRLVGETHRRLEDVTLGRTNMFGLWLAPIAWCTWADTELVAMAAEAVHGGNTLLVGLILNEVRDALTDPGISFNCRRLRLEAAIEWKHYPEDTDWSDVDSVLSHTGSLELIEDLFGARDMRSHP